MNKPIVVEIPQNATVQVVRLQIDEVVKTIKRAAPLKKRICITITQGT